MTVTPTDNIKMVFVIMFHTLANDFFVISPREKALDLMKLDPEYSVLPSRVASVFSKTPLYSRVKRLGESFKAGIRKAIREDLLGKEVKKEFHVFRDALPTLQVKWIV